MATSRTHTQFLTRVSPEASLLSKEYASLLARLSEGRMGVAYSAHVISATADGPSMTNTFPASVCLKFAKPPHSRSLAREAWFYEQLAECQGTSIAHCHVFFSSTFSE